jgi:hypothetical protein
MRDRLLLLVVLFFVLGCAAASSMDSLSYTFKSIFYHFPAEDSLLKECEGLSPMSRWEMNVGWR